ncbi:MAG: hypothetical protein IT243_10580, partial [Bacteroidia bacterium]|nr:hypothetical protein [Bacteroidia bacterium]
MIKHCLLLFVFISFCSFLKAQQIIDYFTYYVKDTSQYRESRLYAKVVDHYNLHYNYPHTAYPTFHAIDDQNIYYINNITGHLQLETYFNDTFIMEKPYEELKSSSLYFCRYNYKTHKIKYLPFGSNYDNQVWRVQMDEQKKSILTLVSTMDDTVRLDPSNQNDFIVFPNRMQRLWLLTFDLEGKLLSKYYFAETDNQNIYWTLNSLLIGKFDFEGDVIITFHRKNDIKSFFPLHQNDTTTYKSQTYIVCYSQKNNNIKWIRFLNKHFSKVVSDVDGIKLLANVQVSNNDSDIVYSDEKGKVISKYSIKTENIPKNQFLTYLFSFDTWGNITPLFSIVSKKGAEVSHIIQNSNDLLALIIANDSFKLFNTEFLGKKSNCLLKLDINKQEASPLLKQTNDTITSHALIKAKRGFYILFDYDNLSSEFNILADDSIVNFDDDFLYKYHYDFRKNSLTICKYDQYKRFKWINKVRGINSIYDNGENTIINYGRQCYWDINFRPEVLGIFDPMPVYTSFAIYNCKPIAYFKSTDLGNNTFKFINLSEYNCQYRWIFEENGIPSVLRSPTHKFKPSPTSYKVMLIVTNECGSDTFFKYFDITDENTAVKPLSFNNNIKVYPNPVSGNRFNVSISENTEIKSLKIYNTIGHQLDECTFNQISKTDYSAAISHKLPKG